MEPVKKPFRFPLSALILRYFAYVLGGAVVLAAAFVLVFGLLLSAGAVLPANYGDQALDDTVAAIRKAGRVDDTLVPASYRWALFSAGGELAGGDMPEGRVDVAREAAFDGLAIEYSTFMTTQFEPVELPGGARAVLMFEYMPQWTSKALRDALPNPQNLLIVLFGAAGVAMVALIAVRAARVLRRKMAPLAAAAERIEGQDLNFCVGGSNVREVDEVLAAIERMRVSLAESLEARWSAEQRQRDQVAALAHDLKTPLTVVRGNIDVLLESDLGDEARASALDAAAGADRLAGTLARLVEVSVADAGAGGEDAGATVGAGGDRAIPAAELVARVRRQAEAFAAAAGVRLAFEEQPVQGAVRGDGDALERALMNVLANAVEAAPAGSTVEAVAGPRQGLLALTVRDEGPGFSQEGLAHASERFWRQDAARAADGHSGLGLHIAREAVECAGGTLRLANRADAPGAEVEVTLPLAEG